MADDDKKGYGLVQPPAAVDTDDNMPDPRGIPARSAERAAPKTMADMPVLKPYSGLPSRAPDAHSAPDPAQGKADFQRHVEEAQQFGPPRPTPQQLASDRAIAQQAARRAMGRNDLEIDENGNVTGNEQEPLSIHNAGDRLIYGAADAIRKVSGVRQRSDLEKAQNDALVAQAKLKTEMVTAPLAMRARQESPAMDAMGKALDMQRVHYRQPIQQEREFSNDQDKEEYIARVKAAMANAAKK